MTENELRARIAQSPEEGFRLLFQQYKGYVYAIVWKQLSGTGSREDAEECVSDVFAEVFLHFGEIRGGTMQGYISTVAKRTAIDAFRRLSAKGKTVSLEEEYLQALSSEEDVEAELELTALQTLLLEKIRSLGEPDATIIIQKYYYDRRSDEIAKITHLRPVTVRVRLNRALKRLRRMLADEHISL